MTIAQRGRLYLQCIMAVTIGLPVFVILYYLIAVGSGLMAFMLVQPAAYGFACLMVATGRAWGRWLLIVLLVVEGIARLTLGITGLGSGIFALLSLVLGVLYAGCIGLLFTPAFETFMRYRQDGRVLSAELD